MTNSVININLLKPRYTSFVAVFISALVISFTLNAQAPATVNPESTTLQQHGNNSSGDPVADESIDSLTTGATDVKYFIYPDLAISPSYNAATSFTANLNSTFAWSTTPATTTINNTVAGYATNYAKITFPNTTGDFTISVVETVTATSCSGTPVDITTRLIAAPDVTAISISNLDCVPSAASYTETCPDATLTISCAVVGDRRVKVNYTIDGPTGFVSVTNDATLGDGAVLDLSGVTLTQPGQYTLTINSITDRIAEKSGFTGIADGISRDFYFTIEPKGSALYHIGNE